MDRSGNGDDFRGMFGERKIEEKTGLRYLLGRNLERIRESANVTSPADYGVSPFLSFFCFARQRPSSSVSVRCKFMAREIGRKSIAFLFFFFFLFRELNRELSEIGKIFTVGARNVNEGKLD